MEFTEEVLKAAKNVHMSKNRGRECGLEHQAEQRVGWNLLVAEREEAGLSDQGGEKERETRLVMGNRTVVSYSEAPVCDEC